MPTLFNNAGPDPGKGALASTLYHVGGTVGGLLISVLLDRFGFVVIAVLFVLAAPAIAAVGGSGMSYAALAPLADRRGSVRSGRAVRQQTLRRVCSIPLGFAPKELGWALAIGRFGAIVGPVVGGQLIKMHLPMRQLFLAAAAPMLIGAGRCGHTGTAVLCASGRTAG